MNALARPESPVATAVVPSPNQDERRDGRPPDIILLHYTGMPDANEALQRLCSPAAKVSCHYLVFEDGRTVQLVPEALRAWHAGISSWEGLTDVNSRSIGIEIANPGHDGGLPPYPRAQIDKVIALCLDLARRWSVRADRVIGHSDVAPDRKDDPGELFPWDELYRAGVGHWVEPVPVKEGRSYGTPGAARRLRLRAGGQRGVRHGDGDGGAGLPAPLPAGAHRRRRRSLDDGDAEQPHRGPPGLRLA